MPKSVILSLKIYRNRILRLLKVLGVGVFVVSAWQGEVTNTCGACQDGSTLFRSLQRLRSLFAISNLTSHCAKRQEPRPAAIMPTKHKRVEEDYSEYVQAGLIAIQTKLIRRH
jgi:hypothetical protein